MSTASELVVEVWGRFACFSRPEMKVERFSYPTMTPSAARGVLEAICLNRHAYRWQVTRVEALSSPIYIALRRNEVKEKGPSDATVMRWMQGKAQPEPIWADADGETKGRTQRQTMALKNVRYRITARIVPWPGCEADIVGMEAKFRRRAQTGKCIYQPYLGCREFPAYFRLVQPGEQMEKPAGFDAHIGWMLYDVFDLGRPGSCDDKPVISLFKAEVRGGIMEVPEWDSPLVLKPGEVAADA